jgi:hypothetical protein
MENQNTALPPEHEEWSNLFDLSGYGIVKVDIVLKIKDENEKYVLVKDRPTYFKDGQLFSKAFLSDPVPDYGIYEIYQIVKFTEGSLAERIGYPMILSYGDTIRLEFDQPPFVDVIDTP